MPFLVDQIDLLMLSVKAPLADAVCATVCRRWREATDLWLDVIREPTYRSLAALCGLEAALKAGLYDLAQYFHVTVAEAPSLPDFLAEPLRESLPIRRNRARYYATTIRAGGAKGAGRVEMHNSIRLLVDLRLYREAIREIFGQRVYRTDPRAAVQLLTICYSALGEHEVLTALYKSRRLHFGGRAGKSMLKNAETCLRRADRGAVENVAEFMTSHPAGILLGQVLNGPGPVFATHG